MNLSTLWRNRNTAQVILILLVLLGVSLALWIEHVRAETEQRAAHLESIVGRLRLGLAQSASALRGQLLEPAGSLDRKTQRETETASTHTDLTELAAELQRDFGRHDQIMAPVRAFMDYHRTNLNPFQRATLSQLETNPPAAQAYYIAN
jgi:hypothetical protein